MQKMTRVLIVDDHDIVREGLRMTLEIAEDLELVGEATDGHAALRIIEETRPDVVLMDLRMPGMDGLAAIEHIRSKWPQIAILILTTYNEDDLIFRGMQAGAHGYLLKNISIADLLSAIRGTAQGHLLVHPQVMTRLLSHTAQREQIDQASALTERELALLEAIARGKGGKEIAAQLHIAERTIRAALNTIYKKLGVDSRTAAVAVAIERGLLPFQSKND